MKKRKLIYPFIVMGFVLTITISCKKDNNQTPPTNTVTDIDGNTYHTVTIGKQTWMVENLKTTKYRNGDPIPKVTDSTAWINLTTAAYCWYFNYHGYDNIKGALYNWYTIHSGKLCPTGWHVPNDAEWTILTTYLGGDSIAGGKLKEAGLAHWQSPNTGATNESGFSALPGGYRNGSGSFVSVGYYCFLWSSSEENTSNAFYKYMIYDGCDVSSYSNNKSGGFSVRCVKD